jgi:hypothetical protein
MAWRARHANCISQFLLCEIILFRGRSGSAARRPFSGKALGEAARNSSAPALPHVNWHKQIACEMSNTVRHLPVCSIRQSGFVIFIQARWLPEEQALATGQPCRYINNIT